MNNEIGRKLTSLTLMTIMLAGGMVIAAPSMVPEAAAAGLLFVSAENADFNNTFGGAQIVEVIVRDPARDETDEKQGEPTVKVDEHLLRMTQGADGYWYAYFGSASAVRTADGANNNLDFGVTTTVLNSAISNSTGPVFTTATNLGGNGDATTGGQCTAVTTDCGGVIRNYPALSNYNGTWQGDGTDSGTTKGSANGDGSYHVNGQIGVTSGTGGEWPFIQTFDFTIETFDVRLEQAGADEVVTLDYDNNDLDDYASIELDRTSASQGSDLHLTITDQQLNIDPTAEDVVLFQVTSGSEGVSFTNGTVYTTANYKAYDNNFDDNGKLIINYNANSAANAVLVNDATLDDTEADLYLVFWESAENSGVFVNTDDDDDSNLDVNSSGNRGTTALIDYNDSAQSFVIANDFGVIDMEEASVGDEWNSGEELTVTLKDQDLNKNTASDEDLLLSTSTTAKPVPSLKVGSPLMVDATAGDITVDSFSNIARLNNATENIGSTANFTIHTGYTGEELKLMNTSNTFFNYDFTSFENSTVTVTGVTAKAAGNGLSLGGSAHTANEGNLKKGFVPVDQVGVVGGGVAYTGEIIIHVSMSADMDGRSTLTSATAPFVADIFSFGDGTNNAIYRLELEETDDNTGVFEGSVEYRMLNQLNVDQQATFIDLETISDTIDIIVHEDLTDEDSPRVNYLDLGADGVSTQIADQLEAPSHSGVVSFDLDNYKIADTVVVTLDDQDMNTDSELIDVYVTSTTDDKVGDGVGDHVLDITFDDLNWQDMDNVTACDKTALVGNEGLAHTGFTLVETGLDSGIFVGSFQIPNEFCNGTVNTATTGKDLEVNYQDFRDASGQTIEVGDGASINANTGSVAFDRTVYPVPWGTTTTVGFAEHATASGTETLGLGNVTVHVRVTDADYDISAAGEDSIADTTVVLKIERGSTSVNIATFGNAADPMIETAPDSGVFEWDQQVGYTDGPTNSCPSAFSAGCVLQGDIITATYTDKDDASGQDQTVTDSATFDLRNGVLQSDKSVYLIGSDMILTLIEPDFDRDNDETESYTLDLIEWDSDAATTTLGARGVSGANAAFDPEPSKLRETGDSTGIFQVVIEIPDTLDSELLDRGEMVELEYTDWGPAGADYVGQEDEDIGLVIYTSNFGATVELDQKVYTWTDKVYITIVAPDHNFDSGLVDEIGNTATDPIKVSTRGNQLDQYKLVESGADTGIFIGEVTLAGFQFDADGDSSTGTSGNDISGTASALTTGSGPTEGKLATTDNDGLTVSFEFSEDETVVGSALIRWNIGEVQWLEASYPASGTGVIRVIDADMNLDPEAIDNFDVDAWSDSDAGGIDLTVTETNEATGIFEGTVFFTVSNDSSGHRLRVAEGDTVTAEYEDNTLPEPYTTADELDITATSLIGTIVPPLERAPAANLRTVDAFGNSLNSVSVDQQVQLTADLANGQDREQSFAYLVQVQDGNGVTVSLAWITGSLSAGQSFSPALSWIPTESGSYTATAFVWESVDNPTALSPPVSTTLSVQ